MDNVLIDWDLYQLNIDKLKEWKIELVNLIEALKDFDNRNLFKHETKIWKLLFTVVKWINANDKINTNDENIIYIEILESIFKIIRNANAGVKENQMNTKDYLLNDILLVIPKCIELFRKDVTNTKVNTCIQCGIQCISNTFTQNTYLQNNYTEELYNSKILRTVFDFEDEKLHLYTIMTVHNILMNNETAVDIITKNDDGQEILKRIILFAPLYKEKDHVPIFDLIYSIFNNIINLNKLSPLLTAFAPIQDEELGTMAISREQTILLKFIDGKLESEKDEFGNNTWDYPKDLPDLLALLFKRVVHSSYKIISDDQDGTYSTADTDGLILLLICFGNLVMTFDEKTRIRLSNLGFVEDIISLLKNANELQPRLRKLEDKGDENNTWFMFKNDIITIISGICYNCKQVQDEIRELGGLPLVLANCNIDNNNPYIKERAVFAIRNLCYRNPENQKIIESLEAKGVDKSVNLDEMGIDAEIDENGKLHVKRLPKKDIKKESSSKEEEPRIQELN